MASVNYYNYTPQISNNQVVFGRAKELAPESSFGFFVLSEHEVWLPSWIRLGKWMAKARVEVIGREQAQIKQGRYRAVGALNPLDIEAMPENCNIVAMAPASLITNAYYTGSYYEIAVPGGFKAQTICLPVGMSYQPERYARSSA
jgi:CRISPR-associated protein Csc1